MKKVITFVYGGSTYVGESDDLIPIEGTFGVMVTMKDGIPIPEEHQLYMNISFGEKFEFYAGFHTDDNEFEILCIENEQMKTTLN